MTKPATDLYPRLSFIALLTISISVELACSWLAYRTIGATTSLLLTGSVGLNLIAIALFASRRRLLAVGLIVALVAAYFPYQAVLGHRLLLLQDEAGAIVRYLNDSHGQTGRYPADLSTYRFGDEALRKHFHEYQPDDTIGGFRLAWYVGSPTTSHVYSPRDGWSYYPD